MRRSRVQIPEAARELLTGGDMKRNIAERLVGRGLTEFFELQKNSNLVFKLSKYFLNLSKIHKEYSRFISFQKKFTKMNYSQLDQDLFCLYESSRGEIPKTFCEIGVGNGIEISNTYLLEQEGWSGLLVEPNPIFHAGINEVRSAILDKRAVSVVAGEGKIELGQKPLLSKVVYKNQEQLDSSDPKIELVNINEILECIGSEVGFLSLDIEGDEDLLVESIDFSKFSFHVLCVEHNYESCKMKRIRQHLEKNGYQLKFRHLSRFDYWFIKSIPSIKDKTEGKQSI